MTETKVRNCSIDIFRYVCAIMVIAIHTNPFTDINEELGYIFTQIIPRIAVPFFFAVAGYFYVQKLEKNQNPFIKYFRRLLITYVLWSALYFTFEFIANKEINLKEVFVHFFFSGSYYHLWFFPALIFSVCLTTFLFKIRLKKIILPLGIVLYIIGCLGCAYFSIFTDLPFLGTLYNYKYFNLIRRVLLMGFPFFSCGYLIYKVKDKILNKVGNKSLFCVLLITIFIWLIEIYVVRNLGWQRSIVITFGLYLMLIVTFLILLKNPLSNYSLLSSKCKTIANFTYYSHPFYMILINFVGQRIFPGYITETMLFVLTTLLTTLSGFIINKINNKFINYLVN